MVDETGLAKEKLAKDIVGEIVLSENPERVLKKWRNIFNFSQKKLAGYLGITSSVISDYESGRRKSPGINVIKKYVNALLELDSRRGGKVIKSFAQSFLQSPEISKAVIDIREFSSGVEINSFCRKINANILTKKAGKVEREIYGYTVIDSVKAISELSFNQLIGLYGTTTQRALVFTGVTTGRTPMVAIKLTNLQPGLVVLHGIEKVDDVAKNIAEAENIPLALCRLEGVEDVVSMLKGLG
ncbi:MAG: helix-turn-helix domain-containing protein [Candidatus Aenigmarchaeota archaeon]|nr:helix-turn-helix domain-containing protein [Candidatus Aenigmarchaeota archaeon]NIP39961.1 helix-turn-helix domain-containing protein [Candidatus Aenigmarchaeota archaeon]NIQ17680.1 helix-turn-helix domain-containing protein [Candidatus Aenigmarchaeota archaeon]NIS72868.1 helix-turn-helix domain-containing protein [Candidatus Aenigmarchaeota archaeon]